MASTRTENNDRLLLWGEIKPCRVSFIITLVHLLKRKERERKNLKGKRKRKRRLIFKIVLILPVGRKGKVMVGCLCKTNGQTYDDDDDDDAVEQLLSVEII